MPSYRYRVVDVFTDSPLLGNPLAVFPAVEGLDPQLMQRIAQELNLSETCFVLPASQPSCLARVRIFTPTREMRFAGHPTIGTAWVLVDEGIVPAGSDRFFLEEGIGPVAVRVERGEQPKLWLTTPLIEFGPVLDPNVCATALRLSSEDLLPLTPQLVSAGNPCVYIPVKDKEAVDRAWCDITGARTLRGPRDEPVCAFVFTPTPEGAYSRMFAPEHGVLEDPATGSATGPLAAYMRQHQLIAGGDGTQMVSEQGVKMGRRSLLHVLFRGSGEEQEIEVGGNVAPLVEATMRW